MPLFPSAYLPSIGYLKLLNKFQDAQIDLHENFIKQSIRNRCEIVSANGRLKLIVPIQHNKLIKIRSGEIKIDYTDSWQKNHCRTIQSAYAHAPAPDPEAVLSRNSSKHRVPGPTSHRHPNSFSTSHPVPTTRDLNLDHTPAPVQASGNNKSLAKNALDPSLVTAGPKKRPAGGLAPFKRVLEKSLTPAPANRHTSVPSNKRPAAAGATPSASATASAHAYPDQVVAASKRRKTLPKIERVVAIVEVTAVVAAAAIAVVAVCNETKPSLRRAATLKLLHDQSC